jgi:hypothetical protein
MFSFSMSNENAAVVLTIMGLGYMKFGLDQNTMEGNMFACYGFSMFARGYSTLRMSSALQILDVD